MTEIPPLLPERVANIRVFLHWRRTSTSPKQVKNILHVEECPNLHGTSWMYGDDWHVLKLPEAVRRLTEESERYRVCENCRGLWWDLVPTPARLPTVCPICHMTVCDCADI